MSLKELVRKRCRSMELMFCMRVKLDKTSKWIVKSLVLKLSVLFSSGRCPLRGRRSVEGAAQIHPHGPQGLRDGTRSPGAENIGGSRGIICYITWYVICIHLRAIHTWKKQKRSKTNQKDKKINGRHQINLSLLLLLCVNGPQQLCAKKETNISVLLTLQPFLRLVFHP